jgi:drug/metabolite transporter (DMT)-like permease
LLLGERITAVTAIGGVIILGAVAVVIRAERAPPAAAVVEPAA